MTATPHHIENAYTYGFIDDKQRKALLVLIETCKITYERTETTNGVLVRFVVVVEREL